MFFKNVMVWETAGIGKWKLCRTLVRHVVEDGAHFHLVARTVTITAGYISVTTEGWRIYVGEHLSNLLVAYRRHVCTGVLISP